MSSPTRLHNPGKLVSSHSPYSSPTKAVVTWIPLSVTLPDPPAPLARPSVEATHGPVHVIVGGKGHMVQPFSWFGKITPNTFILPARVILIWLVSEWFLKSCTNVLYWQRLYIGFDPIFYLHHSFVDNLLYRWMTKYPNYWMGKGWQQPGSATVTIFRACYSQNWSIHRWNLYKQNNLARLFRTYLSLKKKRGTTSTKRVTLPRLGLANPNIGHRKILKSFLVSIFILTLDHTSLCSW